MQSPSLSPAGTTIPQGVNEQDPPDDDPFWIEQVPREKRTARWIQHTSADLYEAARSWDSPFRVSQDDIANHILTPEEVVVLRSARQVAGFVAASGTVRMGRTGHTARYIAGTIVHRDVGGKRKFSRLMSNLSSRAEIEVLHTQSPCMAKALAARNRVIFPDLRDGVRLGDDLFADIQDLLRVAGRKPTFCPVTGIAPTFYARCLYENWPISGETYEGSFRYVCGDSTSAVVVVGFAQMTTAEQRLTRAYTEGATA